MVQIEEIQKSKYVIISVIGPHAGEPLNQIFSRKMTDVKKAGKTFWVISSNKASLELIHQMKTNALKENKDIFVFLLNHVNLVHHMILNIVNTQKNILKIIKFGNLLMKKQVP